MNCLLSHNELGIEPEKQLLDIDNDNMLELLLKNIFGMVPVNKFDDISMAFKLG